MRMLFGFGSLVPAFLASLPKTCYTCKYPVRSHACLVTLLAHVAGVFPETILPAWTHPLTDLTFWPILGDTAMARAGAAPHPMHA